MSVRLRELIRAVRNCKTASEERGVVAKECAAIRTALKEKHPYRARNVAKLMYIHMLGYPTHFGQMECINLISSQKYPEKRIGYLALMILLDETQEVLPLIEHTLKKDLDDKNQFIQALALTALANIASEDICRDLSAEVEKLLFHSPYVRKKAALCAVRIIKKCPDLIENYVDKLDQLLNEKNHGVLLTTLTLIVEIVKSDKKYRVHFRKLIPTLVKMLKTLVMSAYALEHDVNGIADPFLQVKIIRLLRALGKGSTKASELMNDALAQVATNTDNKNPGNAILYECVRAILDIQAENALRTLAVNQLGKFLTNKDNNLRFVALHTLTKVVDRDAQAVNRHLNTILDCLKDHDIAIRKRALELIFALVNQNNCKTLVGELIAYLQHTNDELKETVTTKICTLVQKFAPSKEWKINTLLQLITLAGQFVRDEIASLFIALLSQTPELQTQIVNSLYVTLRTVSAKVHLLDKQETLLQVSVWCIGEYADMIHLDDAKEEDVLTLLTYLLESPQVASHTKAITLTSLVKVSDRFPQLSSQIKVLVSKYKSVQELDMQQRACEFSNLFTWSDINKSILAHMPPITVQRVAVEETASQMENASETHTEQVNETQKQEGKQVAVDTPVVLAPVKKQDIKDDSSSLLLELLDTTPSTQASAEADNHLEHLLGNDSNLLSLGDTTVVKPSVPLVTAFNKNGLLVQLELKVISQGADAAEIRAIFSNFSSVTLADFKFLAAVPNYLQMEIFKASSDTIPANSDGKVSQRLVIKNFSQGELKLKFKISYKVQETGQVVTDQGMVQSFPKLAF